jgi:hypothetical protein
MNAAQKNSFTIEQVQTLRVDALYGKKKHYNASDRKRCYHSALGVTQIVLNVLLGSYLFGIGSIAHPDALNIAVAVLALISATAAALQTFYNFERQAELHRSIGTRYLGVAKECSRIIAYHKDGAIGATALRDQLEQLATTCNQINADGEKCPTSNRDFRKAQIGFSTEEEYTASEKQYPGE